MPHYLLLARSITYAQRMSGVLGRAGIAARPFRPPMGLSDRSCGYALRVGASQLKTALEHLNAAGLRPNKVFSFDGGAYDEVTT